MSDAFDFTPDAGVALAAAPSVQVTSPNGGESVPAGSRTTVTWLAGGDLTNQRVQFTLDGVTFTPIATGLTGDVRSVPWDVPASLVPPGQSEVQARIRVIVRNDLTGEQALDLSDLPFFIRAPQPLSVTVTAPNVNTTVDAGGTLPIQWTSSGATNQRVQFIDSATGAVTPIVTGLDGSARSFTWSIPADLVPPGGMLNGRIRVIVRNISTGAEAFDDGDGIVTVRGQAGPTVTVLAPNVNTTVDAGGTLPIQWNSSGATNQRVQFIDSATGAVTPIVTGLDGTVRSFTWSIPVDLVPPGGTLNGRIRVIVRNISTGAEAFDDGDGIVTIRRPQPLTVQVIQPAGDVTVDAGGTLPIQWNSSGASNQRVQFINAATGAVTPIVTGLDGTVRSFTWSIPVDLVPPGGTLNGRIRVIVRNISTGAEAFDDSDGIVTIRRPQPLTVQVLQPAGDVTVDAGGTLPIQWNSSGSSNQRVQFINAATGAVTPIVTGLDGTVRSFTWNIPIDLVPAGGQIGGRIRVIVRNISTGAEAFDDSDGIVTIRRPQPLTVQVLQPAGDVTVDAGGTLPIQWNSSGSSNQRVQFINAATGAVTPIVTGLDGSVRSFTWSIPADLVPAGQTIRGRIRVIVRNVATGQEAFDDSDGIVTIRGPQPLTVRVIQPATDVTLPVGATLPIEWTSSGSSNQRVQFINAATGAVTPIVTGLDGSVRSFTWSIPLDLVPAGQTIRGRIRVVVRNVATGQEAFDDSDGTVTITGAPAGVQLSPASGPVGIDVVLSGGSLAGATAVLFNGVPSADFVLSPDGTLLAEVPDGAATGTVTIATPGGTLTAGAFTVTAATTPPAIDAFSPASAREGTEVTVTGRNFVAGSTRVVFPGRTTRVRVAAAVDSPTSLRVRVPAEAVTGPLLVKTPQGRSAPSARELVVGGPSVTGFTPTSGAVGDTVTLAGENFVPGETTVRFNGVAAVDPAVEVRSIRAAVPAGASTGPLTVQTPQGTGTAEAPFTVRVQAAPDIRFISPGQVEAGDTTRVLVAGMDLPRDPGGYAVVDDAGQPVPGVRVLAVAVVSDAQVTIDVSVEGSAPRGTFRLRAANAAGSDTEPLALVEDLNSNFNLQRAPSRPPVPAGSTPFRFELRFGASLPGVVLLANPALQALPIGIIPGLDLADTQLDVAAGTLSFNVDAPGPWFILAQYVDLLGSDDLSAFVATPGLTVGAGVPRMVDISRASAVNVLSFRPVDNQGRPVVPSGRFDSRTQFAFRLVHRETGVYLGAGGSGFGARRVLASAVPADYTFSAVGLAGPRLGIPLHVYQYRLRGGISSSRTLTNTADQLAPREVLGARRTGPAFVFPELAFFNYLPAQLAESGGIARTAGSPVFEFVSAPLDADGRATAFFAFTGDAPDLADPATLRMPDFPALRLGLSLNDVAPLQGVAISQFFTGTARAEDAFISIVPGEARLDRLELPAQGQVPVGVGPLFDATVWEVNPATGNPRLRPQHAVPLRSGFLGAPSHLLGDGSVDGNLEPDFFDPGPVVREEVPFKLFRNGTLFRDGFLEPTFPAADFGEVGTGSWRLLVSHPGLPSVGRILPFRTRSTFTVAAGRDPFPPAVRKLQLLVAGRLAREIDPAAGAQNVLLLAVDPVGAGDSLQSLTLSLSRDGGAFERLALTALPNGDRQAVLPAAGTAARFDFKLVAVDAAANRLVARFSLPVGVDRGIGPAVAPDTSLTAAPAMLAFSAQAGGGAVSQALSLASGDDAVGYTAQASVPWLSVDAPRGETPAQLRVTASPAGLAAGSYAGTLTLAADDPAIAAPLSVPVTLTVAAGSTVALAATPAARTIQPGQVANYTITLARTAFAGPVDLAVSGLPAGVTAAFNVDPVAGSTSTLTLRAALTAQAGTSRITVGGTAAGAVVAPVSIDLAIVPPAPTITSLTPASGAAGTQVTLAGTNLGGATAVRFNGRDAASFTVVSPTSITARVPSGATTGPVTVTTPGGTATSPVPFTLLQSAVALAATPASRSVLQGQVANYTITLARTGFAGPVDLAVSGLPAGATAAFNVDPVAGTTSTLTVRTSLATPAGTRTITVSGTAAGAVVTPVSVQLVVGLAAPTVTGFSPASGPEGTTVSITGSNLGTATAVRFGAVAAPFTVLSATQLSARVPQGAATAPVSVSTAAGTAQSAAAFTVTPPAGVVLAASPSAATVTAGQAAGFTIDLARTSFAGPVDLAVSGLPAGATASFSADPTTGASSVLTVATSPATPIGTHALTVSAAAAGISIAPIAIGLTVAAPAPAITGFTPAFGSTGTLVEVTGSGFTGASAVSFNGVLAAFTAMGDGLLSATVPPGAITGPLSVTAPGGTATSATAFTVVSKPKETKELEKGFKEDKELKEGDKTLLKDRKDVKDLELGFGLESLGTAPAALAGDGQRHFIGGELRPELGLSALDGGGGPTG